MNPIAYGYPAPDTKCIVRDENGRAWNATYIEKDWMMGWLIEVQPGEVPGQIVAWEEQIPSREEAR